MADKIAVWSTSRSLPSFLKSLFTEKKVEDLEIWDEIPGEAKLVVCFAYRPEHEWPDVIILDSA